MSEITQKPPMPMKPWRAKRLAEGKCPTCGGDLVPGRAACAKCLKRTALYSRRWRVKNKPEYNAYMRQYMQARRAVRVQPAATQTPSEALLARAKELQDALTRASRQG